MSDIDKQKILDMPLGLTCMGTVIGQHGYCKEARTKTIVYSGFKYRRGSQAYQGNPICAPAYTEETAGAGHTRPKTAEILSILS